MQRKKSGNAVMLFALLVSLFGLIAVYAVLEHEPQEDGGNIENTGYTPAPIAGSEPVSKPEFVQLSAVAEPQITRENAGEDEPEWVSLGEYTIFHYCPNYCCNGRWTGKTASGAVPVAYRTIAVNPAVIAYGSEVMIDGHIYIAENTGATVRRMKAVDIMVATHKEALELGRKSAEVWVR